MKKETNNEIDLLLRRMGRRDGSVARDGEAQTDHLDADELSSYAQNALPAAARARYMEHLADCATCRKLVTELSRSLGAAVVAAPVEAVHGSSWLKKFLASLFSPLVLRYAVPALGVLFVMVVGFVVLRQQRQGASVAQLEPEHKVSLPTAAPAVNSPSEGFYQKQTQEQVEPENGEPKLSEVKAKSVTGAGEATGATAAAPGGPAKDERTVAELQPAATPAAPSAPAKAAPAEVAASRTEAVAKKQPEVAQARVDEQVTKERANEPAHQELRGLEPGSRAAENKPKGEQSNTAGFSGGVSALSRRRAEETKRDEGEKRAQDAKRAEAENDDADTRTIAGRRFRKERGIWIDTAYDSSTATVNMARNSEQFRALVADEPAIGTIAKQLDGEVIVVWKGRAYRIR